MLFHAKGIGLAVVAVAMLAACSRPQDTPLPRDLTQMESVKPAMEKLTPEERELVAGYIMRNTIGAAFGKLAGQDSQGIPEGMTLGKAIDEQRKWKAEQTLTEAKKKEEEAKQKAAYDAAMNSMKDAVSVVLVSKKVDVERGYSGIVMDEKIQITLSYKNNTDKDISGVKGRVTMKDVFGDQLSAFQISNDDTIKAGQSITWTGGRSIKFSMGANQDRKFAELPDDKFTVIWEPQQIAFHDGSAMKAP